LKGRALLQLTKNKLKAASSQQKKRFHFLSSLGKGGGKVERKERNVFDIGDQGGTTTGKGRPEIALSKRRRNHDKKEKHRLIFGKEDCGDPMEEREGL